MFARQGAKDLLEVLDLSNQDLMRFEHSGWSRMTLTARLELLERRPHFLKIGRPPVYCSRIDIWPSDRIEPET
jgi:hypothetical protein